MLQTPSGVKYVRLPASELHSASDLPDVLRAMPVRAPVVLTLPDAGKLDFRYFRECFDLIIRKDGRVCLLAKRAWVGYADGKIVVNNRPAHSLHQWCSERHYTTNGNEDMHVFMISEDKHSDDLFDELATTVLERALRAA